MAKNKGELMSNGTQYRRIFTIREDIIRFKCKVLELNEIDDVTEIKSLKRIGDISNSLRRYNANLQHYCSDQKLKALYDLEVYEAKIELDEIKDIINKLKVIKNIKETNELEESRKKDEIIRKIVKDFGLSYEYFMSIGHGKYYIDNF